MCVFHCPIIRIYDYHTVQRGLRRIIWIREYDLHRGRINCSERTFAILIIRVGVIVQYRNHNSPTIFYLNIITCRQWWIIYPGYIHRHGSHGRWLAIGICQGVGKLIYRKLKAV